MAVRQDKGKTNKLYDKVMYQGEGYMVTGELDELNVKIQAFARNKRGRNKINSWARVSKAFRFNRAELILAKLLWGRVKLEWIWVPVTYRAPKRDRFFHDLNRVFYESKNKSSGGASARGIAAREDRLTQAAATAARANFN
jgi:hypothetical protein